MTIGGKLILSCASLGALVLALGLGLRALTRESSEQFTALIPKKRAVQPQPDGMDLAEMRITSSASDLVPAQRTAMSAEGGANPCTGKNGLHSAAREELRQLENGIARYHETIGRDRNRPDKYHRSDLRFALLIAGMGEALLSQSRQKIALVHNAAGLIPPPEVLP